MPTECRTDANKPTAAQSDNMELTAELMPTNPLRFILELPGSLISVEYRPEKHAVPCNHQGMQVRPQVCCAAIIFVSMQIAV